MSPCKIPDNNVRPEVAVLRSNVEVHKGAGNSELTAMELSSLAFVLRKRTL